VAIRDTLVRLLGLGKASQTSSHNETAQRCIWKAPARRWQGSVQHEVEAGGRPNGQRCVYLRMKHPNDKVRASALTEGVCVGNHGVAERLAAVRNRPLLRVGKDNACQLSNQRAIAVPTVLLLNE
jgi:hypothetical protein